MLLRDRVAIVYGGAVASRDDGNHGGRNWWRAGRLSL
jgi:hypothetical protein